jgi:peptidoglycan-N-acetylglucosamine deacetylase
MPFRVRALAAAMTLLLSTLAPLAAHATGGNVTVSPRILSSTVSSHKVVALTFDDGPSIYTPEVLALLRRFHAHATFFVIGLQAAMNPGEVRAELQDGNNVGDHSFTHPNLQALSDSQVAWQLQTTQDAIRSASGSPTHWFRPPYGAVDQRVSSIAASLGLQTVVWSVDPKDWTLPGADAIASRVLSAIQPGSIVIMHDGGGNRSESVAALATILPALESRGYRTVTLDDLFFPGLATHVAQRCPAGACHRSAARAPRHAQGTKAPASPQPKTGSNRCAILKEMPWLPPSATPGCTSGK